jgi:uncharacterized membrane protein
MGDEAVLGVRARKITIKALDAEKIQKSARFWQVLNVGMPVLFIVLIGFLMAFIRKRKYAN